MNCESASESFTEIARREGQPDAALRAHLDACQLCSERWHEQRALSANLRILKVLAARQSSPDAARSALLREFAARHSRPEGPSGRRWLWGVAAAAVLLIGGFVVRDVTKKAPVIPVIAPELAYEETDLQEEGFIDVPYAPPLAQGEMVRMVHTQLQPAALASMGVNVDPSWTAELPADVLVGQDGFPRAVRVSDESAADSGS